MPKTYSVTRDQAVWERESFNITVPDNVPEDDHEEYIFEVLAEGSTCANCVEVVGAVEGFDVEVGIRPTNAD
jgi:hypothetical protein